MKPMPLVYLAGPYRANTEYGIRLNIRNAGDQALQLWLMGFAVICPHMNTAGWGGTAPDQLWLDGDLVMMARCDAVIMMENWDKSEGATAEREAALRDKIPVLYTMEEARRFLAEFQKSAA